MNDFEKAAKDAGDAIKEGIHRGEADAERAKRSVAGDAMTPGEKAGSMVNEAGDELKAEIDRGKRAIRDTT